MALVLYDIYFFNYSDARAPACVTPLHVASQKTVLGHYGNVKVQGTRAECKLCTVHTGLSGCYQNNTEINLWWAIIYWYIGGTDVWLGSRMAT